VTGWSDIDDYGQPERRREWRTAPDDPPIRVAGSLDVPLALVESEVIVDAVR
jgi:hypothetical protein